METMREYVVRKLKEKTTHYTEVAQATEVSRATLYRIMAGKEALYSVVEKLYNHFKKSAD